MKIEVKGHSGCLIDIVREGRDLYVYKSTSDPKYFNRLILQAEKQRRASIPELQHIRIPKIHTVEKTDDLIRVKMDYIYSRNFVEFFEHAGFEQVNYLTVALIKYIEREIELSKMEIVPSKIIKDKFEDVRNKILSNSNLKEDIGIKSIIIRCGEIFSQFEDMYMPVGQCHGDLTFSNILFNGNSYYLIDFLDSFIESPLLDIVKIRQDTAWLWSQLMYEKPCDTIRLKIAFQKIDKEINEYFEERYSWYKEFYQSLQLMNFLRILQYAHESKVIEYLKNAINKQLREI